MKIGIVDVGSNTFVCWSRAGRAASSSPFERSGSICSSARTSSATAGSPPRASGRRARCAGGFAGSARTLGARAIDVIVTAPGRQSANGEPLVRELEAATGAPVRVLSADEEGRLAFAGAVAAASSLPATVAVCDVGGGSAEAVVGTAEGGPAWSRSLDIGAVRLDGAVPRGRPARPARSRRREGRGRAPPRRLHAAAPAGALATGGTARALRKLVGWELESEEFDAALRILGKRPSAKVAKTFGLHEHRARTLAAGVVILSCLQARLGVPLEVSRAGLREGAALALLDELAASAA